MPWSRLPTLQATATHPDEKLFYAVYWTKTDPSALRLVSAAPVLRQTYPVLSRELSPPVSQYLPANVFDEIGRWTEWLAVL